MEAEEEEEAGPSCSMEKKRRVIRWEKFLPRRSLRVLLIEPDDSTRHVVAALLKKCSYQVTAVADGVKAWEILGKNYDIDLILSEVEVPSITGINLLSKIMGTDLLRSIPVIMMSSKDSVSIVFQCMQKGAADFLVKPVRKNELRNLWQHVWRKHCSTSHINGTENTDENHSVSANMSNKNDEGERANKADENSDDQNSGSKLLNHKERPRSMEATSVERMNMGLVKSQSQDEGEEAVCLANEPRIEDSHRVNDSLNSSNISGSSEQHNCLIRNGFRERDVWNHSAASAFSRYGDTQICIPIQLNIHNCKNKNQTSDLESVKYPQSLPPIVETCTIDSTHIGMIPFPVPINTPVSFQTLGYCPLLQPMFFHDASVGSIDQSLECHGLSSKGGHLTEGEDGRLKKAEQNDNCGSEGINVGGFDGVEAVLNASYGLDCGAESGLQECKRKDMDPRSHREAALLKFRQKRKDRCFEKKVRYHSRKMLAEQRPRVKGQFVRQAIVESDEVDTEVDN